EAQARLNVSRLCFGLVCHWSVISNKRVMPSFLRNRVEAYMTLVAIGPRLGRPIGSIVRTVRDRMVMPNKQKALSAGPRGPGEALITKDVTAGRRLHRPISSPAGDKP